LRRLGGSKCCPLFLVDTSWIAKARMRAPQHVADKDRQEQRKNRGRSSCIEHYLNSVFSGSKQHLSGNGRCTEMQPSECWIAGA
jgi:hypothetical protein